MTAASKKKTGRGRKWLGGYVHHEADGRQLFIIEKQVDGQRFHVSTRCHDERQALAHLNRFMVNPRAYSPAGEEGDAPLVMTVELLGAFYDWSVGDECRNTPKYARTKVRLLGDWMTVFGSKDLRKLRLLEDIEVPLSNMKTSRPARIISLKNFFTWLRTKAKKLTLAQDATLDLPVPQANPEKHVRRKAADWETVRDIYVRLPEKARDILQLGAATGWHITEIQRFVQHPGASIDAPGVEMSDHQGRRVLAVLRTWHKSKKWTRTSLVHQEHVDAARRLREASYTDARGLVHKPGEWVNETRLRKALYKALEQADADRRKVDPKHKDRARVSLGVMRHSVSTWALELGATLELTAAHLDHASKSTTERFYSDVIVPKPPIPTRALKFDEKPRADGEPVN